MNNLNMNPVLPTKEQIQNFPVFKNLQCENIHLISTLKQCLTFEEELKALPVLGFDTESKPMFNKGDVSTGPHLIQLASAQHAYLFQVNAETLTFLKPFFENKHQLKVGFGLKNDIPLFRKKGIQLHHTLDLAKCFHAFGFTQTMGLKNAMALLFQLNFPKSKKISTSNWAAKILTRQQVQYAAADAYAPILVFKALSDLGFIPSAFAPIETKH